MANFWILLMFCALITGAIGAWIGERVHQSATGFWLGLLLGPIGWIIVLLLPRDAGAPSLSHSSGSPNYASRAAAKWADLYNSTDPNELAAFVEAFPGTNEAFEAAKHKQELASWNAANKKDVRALDEFYHKDGLNWLRPEIWRAIVDGSSNHPQITELKGEIESEQARQREIEAAQQRSEAEKKRAIAEEEAQRQLASEIRAKKSAKIVMWVLVSAAVVWAAFYTLGRYQSYIALPVHELRMEAAVCAEYEEQLDSHLAERNAMNASPARDELSARVEDLQYDILPNCRRELRDRQRELGVPNLGAPKNFFDYLI